jgi:hypothetical protein
MRWQRLYMYNFLLFTYCVCQTKERSPWNSYQILSHLSYTLILYGHYVFYHIIIVTVVEWPMYFPPFFLCLQTGATINGSAVLLLIHKESDSKVCELMLWNDLLIFQWVEMWLNHVICVHSKCLVLFKNRKQWIVCSGASWKMTVLK